MDIKAARRVSVPQKNDLGVFKRLRGGSMNSVVCSFWLAGNCNRDPCKFLHPQQSRFHAKSPYQQPKQPRGSTEDRRFTGSRTWQRSPENYPKKSSIPESTEVGFERESTQKATQNRPNKSFITSTIGAGSECKSAQKAPDNSLIKLAVPPTTRAGSVGNGTQKTQVKVCQYWMVRNCVQGDKCQYLHSWFRGDGFSMLAKLEGHNKAITGIALPCGSDKLYSTSKDKSLRVWDCNSGQCASVVNLEDVVGSLISEGPWVFAGLPSTVKGWNIDTQTELTLNGPVGEVYAMAVGNEMLFAGTQDGTILVYKSSSETNCAELGASMMGHSGGVVSLVVGANRLYSGSMDCTIRVWDLDTLQCIQTLKAHTDVVMSVVCWDCYLLSCSLDRTIKVWAASEGGNLEVIYTHNVEYGALTLCGIHDAEAKPIILCSCNDNSVRLYDLPSFTERGRIFAKQEVRAIQIGPGGLFFTGDSTGELCVWKLSGNSTPPV